MLINGLWISLCSVETIRLANQPMKAPAESHTMKFIRFIQIILSDCYTTPVYRQFTCQSAGFTLSDDQGVGVVFVLSVTVV
jgi:hypothetical protein